VWECLPADKPWDVVSVTRRSSGVAPRACVRVYARVLVPPNLYMHAYIHYCYYYVARSLYLYLPGASATTAPRASSSNLAHKHLDLDLDLASGALGSGICLGSVLTY